MILGPDIDEFVDRFLEIRAATLKPFVKLRLKPCAEDLSLKLERELELAMPNARARLREIEREFGLELGR